eukprot:s845_g28.t2
MSRCAEVNGEPSFALVRRNREALKKGRLASGGHQRKAEVLRLFGQLDLTASDGRRQIASNLFRRILEVDPTLATAGLTPTLLWNTLLKAYKPARTDRASLNEEVLAEIMQAYVQAGQISSIDWWMRFWNLLDEAGSPHAAAASLLMRQHQADAVQQGRRHLQQFLQHRPKMGRAAELAQFRRIIQGLATGHRSLVPYQEVWAIFQQLMFSSMHLQPDGSLFQIVIEAFADAHDEEGVQEWLSRARLAGCAPLNWKPTDAPGGMSEAAKRKRLQEMARRRMERRRQLPQEKNLAKTVPVTNSPIRHENAMGEKSKRRAVQQEAIKPAWAFFLGLGSVLLVFHFVFRGKGGLRGQRAPSQAQMARATLGAAPRAEGVSEVPPGFTAMQGPTEEELRQSTYVYSDAGSDCPADFLRLVEPEECEIAAEMLHKKFQDMDPKVDTEFRGCQFRVPDNDVHFNSKEGSGNRDRKSICRKPPAAGAAPPAVDLNPVPSPPPVLAAVAAVSQAEPTVAERSADQRYVMTETESNGCPAGHTGVDKQECATAAKSFDKPFLEEAGPAELDPRGCIFRVPDGDVYFNMEPEGAPHESRKVICRAPGVAAPQVTQAAPATPTGDFVLADAGSDACPAGYNKVLTPEDCQAGANALDKAFHEAFEAESDPKGCNYRLTDQDVYFNLHLTGAPHHSRQPVCQRDVPGSDRIWNRQGEGAAQSPATPATAASTEHKDSATSAVDSATSATPAKFVMGEADTNDCPPGSKPLEESEECEIAASNLGKTYIGEGNPAEMDPKGCQFRIPDQDMYWNTHDTGAPHPARQPICREAVTA